MNVEDAGKRYDRAQKRLKEAKAELSTAQNELVDALIEEARSGRYNVTRKGDALIVREIG